MDASVLSENKAKSAIRKKLKRPTVKVNLCNPHRIQWPQVAESDVKFVLDHLQSVFQSVELKKPIDLLRIKQPKEYKEFTRLKSSQRKQFIEKLNKNHPGHILRSRLVCGVQAVIKSLECDGLQLVLVDRESWDVIKHLSQLAAVRKCPGMAVSGLSGRIAPLLGLNSLCALGFRKAASSDCDVFERLVENVRSNCPVISVPWLSLESELHEQQQESEAVLDTSGQLSESPESSVMDHRRGMGASVTDHGAGMGASVTDHGAGMGASVTDHGAGMGASVTDHGAGMGASVTDHGAGMGASVTDYSHLYLYQADLPCYPLLHFQDDNTEKVFAKHDGMEPEDFIALDQNLDQAGGDKGRSKRKKDKPDKIHKKRAKSSNWQGPVLGKIQGNNTRVSGKINKT